MNIREKLLYYFYRYTAISSQSDESKGVVPSSEGQWVMAKTLAGDLRELGLTEIEISEHAVVTAVLPERGLNPVGVPTIGWCCHMDTVGVKLSPEISPVLTRNYPGGDLCQNTEKGIYIKVSEHPELLKYVGDDILTSDGTSVLGADNKAAIANVMTMLSVLKEEEAIPHGKICIAFVPDEEIGLLGAKSMDLSKFPVDYAYTIDCCERGELIYETFNAGSAVLKIKGVTAHPMSSKNHVVNPTMIAVDFANCFDRAAMPEHTEKKEGFIWVDEIKADPLNGEVDLLIRDHDKVKYEEKKDRIRDAAELMKLRYPRAEISLEIRDTYANIFDALTENNRSGIDDLFTGMKELDIEPNVIAMRGGTDGSYLATQGIMTPNYFTGAHNFHAVSEFLPMSSFEKSAELSLKLVELAVRRGNP